MTTVGHSEPDRIPVDYWAVDTVTERLLQHFGLTDREVLLRRLNVDLRYVMGPSFAGQQRRVHDDGTIEDHWGVLRKPMTVGGEDKNGQPWSWTYSHLEKAPLSACQSVREIEDYKGWPTADMWDYAGVKAECLAAQESGCAVVNGGDRLDRTAQLKPATYLRGMVAFLEDLMLHPGIAECIIERIAGYYTEYNERVFKAAEGHIDIFFMGDDMGTQHGPWISVDVYRQFFKENFKKYNDLAHSYGMKTMYHTCGNVTPLIPEFIDCGLDILQSLQPAAMDLSKLKREYGMDLAFQGGIDIQDTMPKGSAVDVAEEVRSRAETLGDGGGYIFGTAHNLLPDVPTENIVALFDAYAEHGRYS
jgi:uroporphyrinogen decarboxylase